MKKLTYLLGLLLVGGLIFSSCSKDEDEEPQDLTPTIAFETGGEDVTLVQGDTIKFSVACASNSNSGKKLDKFRIYMIIENVEYPTPINVEDIDATVFSAAYDYPLDYVFEGRLYCEVTDVDGQKSSISFNIISEEGTTPLEGEEDLEWIRLGTAPATGLEMFGLKWTSNIKLANAVIKKDSADKFVQLDAAVWETIETKEDLMAAVDAADDMEQYTGVSVDASADYNDVLATKFNDEYFIMHIEHADVVPGSQGTFDITITGKYNK